MSKPTVLIIGATGRTGQRVVDGLIEAGKYVSTSIISLSHTSGLSAQLSVPTGSQNVVALTRPSSLSKPPLVRGVEIRVGDCIADPPAKLAEHLQGVDVLLSTINAEETLAQKLIFKAAVDAGVKRIIPCDFGTPGAKGVRDLHDLKLEVREYLEQLTAASGGRSAYTFIDIGWWAQLAVPAPTVLGPLGDECYTSDDRPVLLTDVDHIGPWVARIIGDPRTANQYVIVWEDELTLRELRELAEAASGEAQALRAKRISVDKDALLKRAAESKAKWAETMEWPPYSAWAFSEYMISIHYLGENSLANAKKLGALDAKELYLDLVQVPFKEYVKKFYEQGGAP